MVSQKPQGSFCPAWALPKETGHVPHKPSQANKAAGYSRQPKQTATKSNTGVVPKEKTIRSTILRAASSAASSGRPPRPCQSPPHPPAARSPSRGTGGGSRGSIFRVCAKGKCKRDTSLAQFPRRSPTNPRTFLFSMHELPRKVS